MQLTHRVLLVGETGVILYTPAETGAGRALSVNWDAPDFERRVSVACIQSATPSPIAVLFNNGDQSYRKEENIAAGGRQTKLEAAFPAEQFPARASMEIAGARKADGKSYLLVALQGGEHMVRLADALKDAPVMGCGVLPIESTGLVDALADKLFGAEKRGRWAMLVGQHETGGLRQVVTRDGVLALTRLIPAEEPERAGRNWGDFAAREARATHRYLAAFGLQEADGFDVMIVCGAEEARLFSADIPPGTRRRCLTQGEALTLLGCRPSGHENDHFADDLHALWTERRDALTLSIPVPDLAARRTAH